MLNLVLFGAPGSGKGTQSAKIIDEYGLHHISTGDVLRDHIARNTPDGKTANEYISKGNLIPDELMMQILEEELDKHIAAGAGGVVFDGFPRTIPQADAMKDAGVPLDFVLEIDVPDAEIVERMSGRRAHLASGRTYHVKYNPPKVEGKDDVTGEDLVQRDDDKEETVKKRLDVYHSQTKPLVEYYSTWAASGDAKAPKVRKISGLGAVDAITANAFAALK